MWTLNKKIIFLVLAVTILLSILLSIVMFYYSRNEVLSNIEQSARVNSEKLASDFNDLYQETLHCAQQASIEDSVQKILSEDDSLTAIERNRNRLEAYNNLKKIQFLRGDIGGFVLVCDGEVEVWTEIPFWDDYSRNTCQQWYQAFLTAAGQPSQSDFAISWPFSFSVAYYMPNEENEMFGVQIPLYAMDEPSKCRGSLIVLLQTDTLEAILAQNLELFDAVGYYADQRQICALGVESAQSMLEVSPDAKQGSGYILCSEETKFGGTLVTVIQEAGVFRLTMRNMALLLIVVLAAMLLTAVVMIPVMLHLTRPIQTLLDAMGRIGQGDMQTRVSIQTRDEFQLLGKALNQMVEQLDRNMQLVLQHNQEKQELEYEVLVAQINPHFIYNTLNTVIYLSRKNRCEDVICITRALIDLLQDGIKLTGNKNFSTVQEELWIIRNYACIQNYRYSDKFDVEISCPEELLSNSIPASIIQPLVENALFHGIVPLDRRGHVRISLEAIPWGDAGGICISIVDNGVGISEEKIELILSGQLKATEVSRNHVGLRNVIHRLSLLYGEQCCFHIRSKLGYGTEIEIRIPNRQNK